MFRVLSDEIQAIYVMLGASAGFNPISDSELRGRIKATQALLEVDYSDIYGEDINDN